MLTVNFQSRTPVYQQLYDDVVRLASLENYNFFTITLSQNYWVLQLILTIIPDYHT